MLCPSVKRFNQDVNYRYIIIIYVFEVILSFPYCLPSICSTPTQKRPVELNQNPNLQDSFAKSSDKGGLLRFSQNVLFLFVSRQVVWEGRVVFGRVTSRLAPPCRALSVPNQLQPSNCLQATSSAFASSFWGETYRLFWASLYYRPIPQPTILHG